MRSHFVQTSRLLFTAGALLTATAAPVDAQPAPAARSIVLRATRVLDGTGAVLTNRDVVIVDGRITAIRAASGALPAHGIDLRGRTLLPGLIDTHVHLGWYLTARNRLHQERDGDSPTLGALNHAGNAWATLRAGFTTVQSIGEADNAELRDAINRGVIPGPRVITSLGSLSERSGGGSPDSLRAVVRRFKERGADVIKIFASKSIRDGGEATMTAIQLEAACGESRTQGLRSVVHAHSAEAVQRVARAGCTQVEHGVFADDATRALLVERGTFFDPQCGLVFRNYLDNKSWFEGIGNYNAAGFASMEQAVPLAEAGIGSASRTKRLKLVFGTDAVAGAHGRNAEELVCRVRRGGQPAMDALVSATSLAAESLGLEREIGRIAVGYAADLIATDGDPSVEIEATQRVRFVMRNGQVYRNDVAPARTARKAP
ncbi:MAG: amidohydrolase family protein [Gemmatimonas sp.]